LQSLAIRNCNRSPVVRIYIPVQQSPEELDRELVTAVLANRPGAFERLVAAHQGLCWHIIYRIVRHPEDARDLCQESFMRVYRYLSGYRYESSLKTWIGRIAYSTAVRHLERKRIPLLELSDPEGEDGGALGTTLCEDSDV
jgi:DNA-directed RNA polymerase specialized sigma24 family protein